MYEIFSSSTLQLRVLRTEDGELCWQGTYHGMKIVAVELLDGNSRCLILLDPDATRRSYFENLLCVDANGNVLWRAQLIDTSNDTFVSVRLADGLYANTWSGYRVRLDPATGAVLEAQFVK